MPRWPQSNGPKLCALPECRKPTVNYWKYCAKHYMRYLRHGDPQITKNLATLEGEYRLKAFEGLTYRTWNCWFWLGVVQKHEKSIGYGLFGSLYAHRVAYELYRGPIPEGLQVLHHCDNPRCVNPDHLFLGTSHDNKKDEA